MNISIKEIAILPLILIAYVNIASALPSGRLTVNGDGYLSLIRKNGNGVFTKKSSIRLHSRTGELLGVSSFRFEFGVSLPLDAVAMRISEDGIISFKRRRGELVVAGQLVAAYFANSKKLKPVGRGLFRETKASGRAKYGDFTSPYLGKVIYRPN